MEFLEFDEVIAFDERNYDIYRDIVTRYKDKGIIPFIGAGMSVIAGFPTWASFLDKEYKECINDKIRPSDPLDKASEIYKEIGAAQFRKDVVKTFGGEFSDADWNNVLNNVQNQAIGLLPKLFHNVIVVTTNFDRLLEHLYPATVVSHPSHDGQLNRALNIGTSMIFKLHGCVSEPEEIILTRESYARVYETGENKEAVRALEKILTNQTVFFLGCSLKNDYTVKHWTKMIAQPEGKGIEHFAVISCRKDERQIKRRELGDMNIFPILYDENNHDAVRVILNKLYSDTNGGKPINNLLQQNKYFSGRIDQLKSINNLFKKIEHNVVNICQTVSGLGGIGKTTLAIEYAYRYYDSFKNCIWFINAETTTTTQNYFVDFANRFNLKLPPEYKPEELQRAVKMWLSENKEWLLIFDNLESVDTINPYLPNMINGRIIITTRNTRIDFGSQIALGVFNMDEAMQFLRKRLSNNEKLNLDYNNNDNDFDTEAPNLITRLGFLPLALEQAAAYIKKGKCTITKYLKLLSESGLSAFEEKYAVPEHYEKSNDFEKIVTATWNISFKSIPYEGSRQLLNLCAYMAPDRIPVAFFAEMREKLPSPIKEDMAEERTKINIVGELRVYSLTTGDADYINVHRLVQEVVRKNHEEQNDK